MERFKINNGVGYELKMIEVKIKKLYKDAKLPESFQKKGDVGIDAYVYCFKYINDKKLIPTKEDKHKLRPLDRIACPLGFATEIPDGYYAQVVPRSGLALWDGLSIVNSPGTIDSGYRNEWIAIVVNISNKTVILEKNERICQIILRKATSFKFIETEELNDSERGLGGFGSTGKK